jgi:hypothetical protein
VLLPPLSERYNPFLYLRGKKEPVKVNLLGRPARRSTFESYQIDKLPKPLIDQRLLERSSNAFQRVGIHGADSSLTFNPRHHVQQQLQAELAKSKAAGKGDANGSSNPSAADLAQLMKHNSSTFAPMRSGGPMTEMSMADAFASLRGDAPPAKKADAEEQKQLVPSSAGASSALAAMQAQSALHPAAANSSDEPLLVVKGASEQILAYCDKYMQGGEVFPMTQEKRDEIAAGILSLSSMGERVLGFAELPLDKTVYTSSYAYSGATRDTVNVPLGQAGRPGLIFVGLMAMVDPPRQGVAQAVLTCKRAGIKVIMVTGKKGDRKRVHPFSLLLALRHNVSVAAHPRFVPSWLFFILPLFFLSFFCSLLQAITRSRPPPLRARSTSSRTTR